MLTEIVESLDRAARDRSPRKPITTNRPDFSIEEAYRVQEESLQLALARGEKLCGYKMGLTSRAKQQDVNVFEPIRGYLLSGMEVQKGDAVQISKWIHPRVEPELAVILKRPLEGNNVQLRDVVSAIEWIGPACEILDSRFDAFTFKLPDVVADNTSAAGFMVGRLNYLDKLEEVSLFGVVLKRNGEIEQTGAPAAVLGDPLLSVVGLVRSLAKQSKRIEPGQVILTGGITASVPFAKGDQIEIVWPGETLSFRAL